jgi:hypothetical protein
MHEQGFNADLATRMAAFCSRDVAWFLVFLIASSLLVVSILGGVWRGQRAKWAWIVAGALLVADLGRADAPYIYYFDWKEKYSANPVVDFLAQQPFEHRVASKLSPLGGQRFSVSEYRITRHFPGSALAHFGSRLHRRLYAARE